MMLIDSIFSNSNFTLEQPKREYIAIVGIIEVENDHANYNYNKRNLY